ncbi:MAG: YidC/Oxa1 family membrane protein insertase [Gammaproteobacteria bacterium]|jgi:YidC/Oxa1 family membrane protein insertase
MPIEQLRSMLLIGLMMVGFLLWQAWEEDYAPEAPALTASVPGIPPAEIPKADVPNMPAATATSTVTTEPSAGSADIPLPPGQIAPTQVPSDTGDVVRVRTDLLEVAIQTVGGTLSEVRLIDYDKSADKDDGAFTLITTELPDVFLVQSGLVGHDDAPTHRSQYKVKRTEFQLAQGKSNVVVPMTFTTDSGIEVTKRFIFSRDSYVMRVEHEIRNAGNKAFSMRMYGQLHRAEVEQEGGLFRTYTYTGGVISQPEKPYEKIDFGDMADQNLDVTYRGGWIAMIQHYFAAAVIPPGDSDNYYYSLSPGGARFVLGVMDAGQSIAPGQSVTLAMDVYAGPKKQERMLAAAPNLERTVDYGWLWFIAEPIFYALRWIQGFIGNWGFSIILLTMGIKLLFFHLSAASYRSMARMRKLQPRIVQLRERYSSDKQRMNQAMMELYKAEKINPLGGCLPILVQIPVFISLYWVLLESVELRHSPFIGWITDLSDYDPYFVLPLLMGASMFFQQRLNPAPPDPMQAKIMMMLPLVFTFLFLFFPSGLVLYWFVNNLLSIAQQWVITRRIVGPNG